VGNIARECNMRYSKRNFPEKLSFGYLDNGRFVKENIITSITVSLVNRDMSKTLYIHSDKPTDEMVKEIRHAKNGSCRYTYVWIYAMEKAESVWTRFTLGE
jgi:hypothetical protein